MIQSIRTLTVLLALAVPVIANAAPESGLRVAVVDPSVLLQQSPQAKNASDEISKKFDGRKKELMADQDKIKSLQDDLSKNGAVMSASQAQDEQTQLDELQRDFSRKSADFQDDYNMERNAVLSRLQQAIIKAVQEFAQAQKYDLIVNAEGLFYKNKAVDVTDQVLAQMKKDYDAGNAKSGD